MNKIKGLILIVVALIFFIACGATVSALIYSFTVKSTLTAVESVFGSLVLGLCFLALGFKAFRAGKAQLKSHDAS